MSGTKISKLVYVFLLLVLFALGSTLVLLANEQAKQRLYEADAYDLVSANPEPTIVCVDDRIVLWNDGMALVTGFKASEMIGKKTTVIVEPELVDRHVAAIRSVSEAPGFARGVKFLILPIRTQHWGRQKIPATVCHLRRHDGRVIMIARFAGAVLHPSIRWYDVETETFMKIKSSTEAIEKKKDS